MRSPNTVEQPDLPEGADARIESAVFQSRRGAMFRALRHRDYRLLWGGAFLSNIGTWMQAIAQGWLVRELTPSPFLIGFVAFAGSFPQLAFALFSGVYADMFDRRRLLIGTQAVQMILSSILGLLVALNVVTIWQVIAISFASGLAATLSNPAYQAFVHDIVGREDLMSGIALNSTQFNLSRIIGPTVGGIMLSSVGIAGCFYLNGLSFLAVIAALWLIRVSSAGPASAVSHREMIPQLRAGLHYVRGRPRVLALLGMASVVSIFGIPYLVFLPVFARDVLGVEARGLSYLMAATGTGAVVSALVQAFLGNFRGRGRFLIGGMLLFGTSIMVFALSHSFALSCVCLMFIGGAMVSITAMTNNLLQMLVTDEMRGRVMSMYSLAFIGLAPVGSLFIGSIADLIGSRRNYHGVQLALAASGAMVVLFAFYVLIAEPRVRKLE
ncbi:MAG TPA: MFS transporter [Blastocatellia bacterium]|nr:MFS transporter [Blastocatellia bacterium]